MKRSLSLLILGIALAAAAATAAYAVRHQTLTPMWNMAWLPAVVAGALYLPAGRRCRRQP